MATASETKRPVGYLVNHPDGLIGSNGIGFDYVLGSGGLYVQSESAHLTARVLAAPCEVRGLAPVTEKVELAHGPIPAGLFEVGLRWFEDDPDTERFFAVRWDGRSYRLVVPEAASGRVIATIHPRAISIHLDRPGGSPRNSWPTRIERIDHHADRVRVQTGNPLPVTAEITPDAQTGLNLAPGSEVWLSVKATEIQVNAG